MHKKNALKARARLFEGQLGESIHLCGFNRGCWSGDFNFDGSGFSLCTQSSGCGYSFRQGYIVALGNLFQMALKGFDNNLGILAATIG